MKYMVNKGHVSENHLNPTSFDMRRMSSSGCRCTGLGPWHEGLVMEPQIICGTLTAKRAWCEYASDQQVQGSDAPETAARKSQFGPPWLSNRKKQSAMSSSSALCAVCPSLCRTPWKPTAPVKAWRMCAFIPNFPNFTAANSHLYFFGRAKSSCLTWEE